MRIRVIDAFTDRPFAGKPAGVCLLDTSAWPDEAWMRRVAAEMNLETAFAHPLPEGSNADWALRWFIPAGEANLCGHATLATAHALYSDRAASGTVRFASPGGILIADTRHDGTITLDFPAAPPTEAPAPDGIADALGAEPEATYRTGALGDLLAVVGDEATVRALSPDFAALARLTRRDVIRGVIATAPAAHWNSGYDFVSRYFAPANGIPEDPVTGSAHTAWPPTGRSASAATASPGCRPPPAPAWSTPRSTATVSTSPATPSASSTASCTTPPDSHGVPMMPTSRAGLPASSRSFVRPRPG